MIRTCLFVLTIPAVTAILGCGSASSSQAAADPPLPVARDEPASPASEKESDTSEGTAPMSYRVKFETSTGDFVIDVERDWSPHGADRFYELVKTGFYDGCRFFRVVDGFVVQFGMNGDPEVQAKWSEKTIPDDPVVQSNKRGFVTFAKTARPDSRSTQLFINLGDNTGLDARGFAPIGQVTQGMDVVDSINAEYGQQPDQGRIRQRGNEYLKENFPNLDYIEKATIVEDQ